MLGAPAFLVARCGGAGGTHPAATPGGSPTTPATRAVSTTPAPSPEPAQSPSPPAPTAAADATSPLGFPIDPDTVLGLVEGEPGSRVLTWGAGAHALAYSRDDQTSDDPALANRCGWNARTHVQYEGQPAVDWYVPLGTPILATLDGTATLLINTVSNPFDVYGVSREAYIGDPDEPRAPLSPFAGPGGGQGVFVRVTNQAFSVDFGHMDIAPTISGVPAGAFLGEYTAATDYAAIFAALRNFGVAAPVASWPVRRGDVIGYSGDSGYSEAPHLHYAIRRAGAGNLLCPTAEAGFEDGGWLFR